MSDLPQTKDGSFPIPNSLIDSLMPLLRDTELRVLLVVLRQTRGWPDPSTGLPKARDWLTHGRLKRTTGRASEAVSSAVDALVRRGLLIVEDERGKALATPAERRRLAAALYFRPGPQLAARVMPETGPRKEKLGAETEFRKAKTTKDIGDNNHFSFRKSTRNAVESAKDRLEKPMTPEQIADIEATRRQIRARLARITRSPGRSKA